MNASNYNVRKSKVVPTSVALATRATNLNIDHQGWNQVRFYSTVVAVLPPVRRAIAISPSLSKGFGAEGRASPPGVEGVTTGEGLQGSPMVCAYVMNYSTMIEISKYPYCVRLQGCSTVHTIPSRKLSNAGVSSGRKRTRNLPSACCVEVGPLQEEKVTRNFFLRCEGKAGRSYGQALGRNIWYRERQVEFSSRIPLLNCPHDFYDHLFPFFLKPIVLQKF